MCVLIHAMYRYLCMANYLKGKMEMGKRDFQKDVRKNGGYILSDGTLNLKHLLPKAYDLMVAYRIRTTLPEEILKVVKVEGDVGFADLFLKQYYGEMTIPEENEQDATYLWNEDVYNFFNELSPAGYYFGGSDGDGACIGWFKME